jgi:hypothetical protein
MMLKNKKRAGANSDLATTVDCTVNSMPYTVDVQYMQMNVTSVNSTITSSL